LFAVTQLSHLLLGHLTTRGAPPGRAILLAGVLVGVELHGVGRTKLDSDPEPPAGAQAADRADGLIGLIMSAAIPQAFRRPRRAVRRRLPSALGVLRGGFMVYRAARPAGWRRKLWRS